MSGSARGKTDPRSQGGAPASGREVIVEAAGARKVFGRTVAVADVSFTVRRGEIVGLLGPNGAGKTTVIQLLLGLTTPSGGRLRLFGCEFPARRVEVLQRCNFASAYVALPWNLTVEQNLRTFAELYHVERPRERIAELLELLEIAPLRREVTGRLSSGEQTRVNLCKALLNDPELLLLDEPTASLDPEMADKARRLLRRLREERGITMLYTSHNMRDVEEVCDRVLFLHRGRLLAEGSPAEIVERFRSSSLEEVFIVVAREGDLKDRGGP